MLHARPSVGSTDSERFYALSTECARKRFWLTNSYFVPDRDFRAMLCRAVTRGVDVRIITAGPATDIKSTLYAGRDHYGPSFTVLLGGGGLKNGVVVGSSNARAERPASNPRPG